MPLVGWEVDGVVYDLDQVAALARAGELVGGRWPAEVLAVLADQPRDPYRLRASDLGGCLRQKVLEHYEPYTLRPDDRWEALVGTGVHAAIARQSDPDSLVEVRLSAPLPVDGETLTLSGQIDRYHRPSRTLTDYKTTGSVVRVGQPGPDHSYVLQANAYAWLLRQHGEDPVRARLWFVERQGSVSRATGRRQVRSRLVEVDLMDPKAFEDRLVEIGRTLLAAHREGKLPPALPADHPFCRWCPVVEVCRQLEQESGGAG